MLRNPTRRSRYLVVLLALAPSLAAVPGRDPLSPAERLRSLSAAEKEDLEQRRRRFEALPEAERQRLRELHEKIERAPDGERLVQIMHRYHNWLKTLQPATRAELQGLDEDQRVSKIQQLLQAQAAERFREYAASQLESSDLEVIEGWLSEMIGRHTESFKPLILPQQRDAFARWDAGKQLFALRMAIMQGQQLKAVTIPTEEIELLAHKLSPKARQALAEVGTPQQQADLIREWIRAAAWARVQEWRKRFEVTNEELLRFRRENLSDEEQQWLQNLNPEDIRPWLMHKYMEWRGRGGGRGRRGRAMGAGEPRKPWERILRSEEAGSGGAGERGSGGAQLKPN